MSEEEVVYYGAPTLAGLKTGNLMSCPYESRQKTMDELRALNDELVPKGICLYPLRFHKGRVLVYMFRPSFLQRDLSDKRAWEILDAAGYSRCDYSSCMMELIRRLRKAGAKSDATRGCGVHIHIGANGHTAQTLRNLANLMASHERLIATALKINEGRMSRYCRTVNPNFLAKLNSKKPKTMSQLADIWYEGNGANYGRSHHYNDSRYHMLNLHATFTKGTVEFRLFQFDAPSGGKQNGLHAGQLKSYIQLCLALSEMAKELRTASPREQQKENPKYAMRTWLLRLGFIGEEFATARDILTRNLDGDTAFRHGRA